MINQQISMEAKVIEGERVEEKVGQEHTIGESILTKEELMVVESSKTGTLQEQ